MTQPESDALLQERIAKAIQPVLADFERQVAQIVEQQLVSSEGDGERAREAIPPPPSHPESENDRHPDAAYRDAEHRHAEHPGAEHPDAEHRDAEHPDAGARASADSDGALEQRDDSAALEAPRAETRASHGAGDDGFLHTVRQIVHGLEEQSGDWVDSFQKSAINVLFSEGVQAAVHAQLEEALTGLVDDICSGLTSDPESRAELQGRTERLLQDILDELIRDLFEGPLRREVQHDADEAVVALRQLDFDVAVQHVTDGVQALVLGIVRVLVHHWGGILKVLLQVVIEYFQNSVTSSMSDTVSGVLDVVQTGMEVEEKGEELQEQFKEKTNELGDKLREATETMRERIAESSEQLRTRLQEGVKEGQSGHQLGRPPSGRLLGKAPSGRPPNGRPPSAPAPAAQKKRK